MSFLMRNLIYFILIFIFIKEISHAEIISLNEKNFNAKNRVHSTNQTKKILNMNKINIVSDSKDLDITLLKLSKNETIFKKIIANSSVKVNNIFTIEKDDNFDCNKVKSDYKSSELLINNFD
jgi:hypothetical protein